MSIYLATSPDVAGKTGGYYIRSAPVGADGARTEIALWRRAWVFGRPQLIWD